MPRLNKQVIAHYLRSDCLRRLRLDLSPESNPYDAERAALGMPDRLVRPGLAALSQSGREWEHAKLNDLVQTFGPARLKGQHIRQPDGTLAFGDVELATFVRGASPGDFIVQPTFDVTPGGTLETGLAIGDLRTTAGLDYSRLRPDIIQVLAVGSRSFEALADGTARAVPPTDRRRPLRVIDIKLTAEPSVPYFGELTFYTMTLAGWLRDQGLDGDYFVAVDAAVWPGSHDASRIVRLQSDEQRAGRTPTAAALHAALEQDLEPNEFGVFAPRIRRFLQEDLRQALSTPWQVLPWHVDNRCIGCEYLGYPWPGLAPSPRHCWSEALSTDNLSRVAFVTRGARSVLEGQAIGTVAALSATPSTASAYDDHHVLRATRTVVAGRAQSLQSGLATVPPQAGTSAVMPAWADLRIYVTADFDIGSGITIAFGFAAVRAFSRTTPLPPGTNHYERVNGQAFPVDQRSLAVEYRELERLLQTIDSVVTATRNLKADATIQVYLWDQVTYDHLVRVMGRHLGTIIQNGRLRWLAWLFPPDSVVANPDLSDRMSPITVVREVIRAVVAAPVPHYYSLLNVAREYHSAHTQAPYNQFSVPQLFEDPLSDQIPSERAHEIWSRASGRRPWNQQLQLLERTVRVRLSALESVAQRIGDDLQGQLDRTAPRIQDLRPPSLPQRMADDARLWFIFAQLNVALDHLDQQQVLAMPAHEREARFRSARLSVRLDAAASAPILASLGLAPAAGRWTYGLAPGSSEVRAREGDFDFALAPENRPGFLGEKLRRVAGGMFLPLSSSQNEWTTMQWVTAVTVRGLDRDGGFIVVDVDTRWLPTVNALEAAGAVDLSQDVMLDPVHRDFLIDRLKDTLNAIGNPQVAINNALPEVRRATGQTRRPTPGGPSPVADLYWSAATLHTAAVPRVLPPVRALLAANNYDLNPSQWVAWEEALSHRLRLIWGPPGTGKSRTLRTVVFGALLEAAAQRRPLRVLITGPTYEAIDNVLLDVSGRISTNGPLAIPGVLVARLRSSTRAVDPSVPAHIDASPSSGLFSNIVQALKQNRDLVLVGATTHQAHRLLTACGGAASPVFDLILVDEASQVDVATSTMALAGLAAGGSVVIAGDPRQLPPIHQAQPPEALDYVIGPIFTYLAERFGLPSCDLQVNYRSNSTVVELAHAAGYNPALHAQSPNLRIDLVIPLPTAPTPPTGWPASLHWTPEWSAMLDPQAPATVFVYPDGRSSQWNPFEAEAVAALTWLLWSRLGDRLAGDTTRTGFVPGAGTPYSQADFWGKGIGVVTPHRAQQAMVNRMLQSVFPTHAPQAIRDAVDTVERFQGQERDVIIATFAMGDADAISAEDEFLLSLNRFNVMASRARAKLVVLIARELVDHLSSDADVLRGSALLKTFAESFCDKQRPMQLGFTRAGAPVPVVGSFRWRR